MLITVLCVVSLLSSICGMRFVFFLRNSRCLLLSLLCTLCSVHTVNLLVRVFWVFILSLYLHLFSLNIFSLISTKNVHI